MGHLRSTYPPELGHHHHHCTLLQLGTTTVHCYHHNTTNDTPPPQPPGQPPLLTDQRTTTATPPQPLPLTLLQHQNSWAFHQFRLLLFGKVHLKPMFISLYSAESVVGLCGISWSRKGDSLATRGWVGEHGISGHRCSTLHRALSVLQRVQYNTAPYTVKLHRTQYNTAPDTVQYCTGHSTILHRALYNTAPCTA